MAMLLAVPAFSGLEAAETAYISDQVRVIWTRTGPSEAYKVKYKLAPGEKFEILQRDPETGYAQIRDEAGRQAWIEPGFLTGEPPASRKLSLANNKIQNMQKAHESKVRSLEEQVKKLQPLKGTNQDLNSELAQLQTSYEQVQQEKQAYQGRFNREMFFSGAIVFIGGMVVGWVFSRLTGRKKNSGWS